MTDRLTERNHDWIMERAEEIKALGRTEPRFARDPVNQPAINAWLDAIGDTNPIYRATDEARELNGGPVAPTAMAQVWTMYGLGERHAGDPLHEMMNALTDAGYTGVLGTNCDQTYDRYVRPGEVIAIRSDLESVVGPKSTAMGEGYFVTSTRTWYVGDEQVATMLFRVLKFKPAGFEARSARASTTEVVGKPIPPMVNRDSEYFWDGTAQGELRIQQCEACGQLRHPPGPMCPSCHETKRSYVVASGRGTVYSFVVHHAPQIPGKVLPLRLGVVELAEGVRMVGELVDDVTIGDDVEAVFQPGDGFTLVAWRRA
ncbi:MAG TPA: OB-fold domain-containing protein [Nocardioidaceae bacterium]|nr:OB-fold domain-containing protein [Nocardioidaceae bacterium]